MFVVGAAGQVNVKGQWTTQSGSMPINPVHAALMYNGKILVVAGSGNCPPTLAGCSTGPPFGPSNNSGAAVYDPVAGTFSPITASWDMFCNGMIVLPDGRPFVNGGVERPSYDPFYGTTESAIFDPSERLFGLVQPCEYLLESQHRADHLWQPRVWNIGAAASDAGQRV